MTGGIETPIICIVFNRPSTARSVFERIAQARPLKLLIIADGARPEKTGEADACRESLEIVTKIDWECEVLKNISPVNLGCGERIISGLNWAFSLVDEAIILEDDCLPDPSFFPFCRQMLERYRDDPRVASVGGTNLMEKHCKSADSYYFSRLGGIWGWATWKSRWMAYDRHLTNWPAFREARALNELFDHPRACSYWTKIFDSMYAGNGPNTWDYQWIYTNLLENRVHIVPHVNLVKNIGFGAGATHTSGTNSGLNPEAHPITFPLRHPAGMVVSGTFDRSYHELAIPSLPRRIALKTARIVHAVFRSA